MMSIVSHAKPMIAMANQKPTPRDARTTPRRAENITSLMRHLPTLILLLLAFALPSPAQGFGQSALDGPAVPKSPIELFVWKASVASPLSNGTRLAIQGQSMAGAFVVGLFDAGRPFTIAMGIRAVVIDPFKSESLRRTSPHTSQNPTEAPPPFVAHPDTPASVAVVILVPRVVAASFRGRPDHVLDGESPATCGPMTQHPLSRDFALQAATTFRITVHEWWRHRSDFTAAITATQPSWMAIGKSRRHTMKHAESSEATAG